MRIAFGYTAPLPFASRGQLPRRLSAMLRLGVQRVKSLRLAWARWSVYGVLLLVIAASIGLSIVMERAGSSIRSSAGPMLDQSLPQLRHLGNLDSSLQRYQQALDQLSGAPASQQHFLALLPSLRADLERDFEPFRTLNWAPMAMTAHVTYTAIDATRCATLSPVVIDLIRTDIGFQGLLMSDDLGMKALGHPSAGGYPAGSNALEDFGARALASLAAGCDIALHCSGDFAKMRSICEAVPEITAAARARLDAALAGIGIGDDTPAAQWAAARDKLLALA